MYEHILVALDGSPLAEQILLYVQPLAPQFGSTVILLRATTPPATLAAQSTTGIDPILPGMLDPTPLVEAERQDAQAYLEAVADRLHRQGLMVQVEQHEGPAADVILERSAALEAGPAASVGQVLIAMTTHGRGGLGRLLFGSVADAVLRHVACPILLVRVDEKPRAPVEVPVI